MEDYENWHYPCHLKLMLQLEDLVRKSLVSYDSRAMLMLPSEIWKETGSRAQLKLLKVIKYAGEECIEDHRLLNEMTHTLLFTNRP